MEKDNAEVFEIDLLDLWRVFVRRLWIILLVTVICTVAYFACDKATFVPEYESTATMYILRQGSDTESYAEQFASQLNTNFTMAMNVVTDCTYLLRDEKIVNRVIEEMDLKMSYEELSQKITITNPTDTRILKVQVKASSPKKAQKIVDKLCTVGADGIKEAMGIGQANFYAKGVYNSVPCNKTPTNRYLMVALIAALLTYMYFVVRFLLDDGIHSEEDVEKYLGLTVLAEIPDIHGDSKRGRYGKKYGSYGYGYGYGASNYGNRVSDSINRQNGDAGDSEDRDESASMSDYADYSGYTGSSEYSGASDYTGTTEYSGTSDYTGTTEYSGASDYTGTTEYSGASDYSVTSENSGISEDYSESTGSAEVSGMSASDSAGWTDEASDPQDYSRFAPPSDGEQDPAGTQSITDENEGRY